MLLLASQHAQRPCKTLLRRLEKDLSPCSPSGIGLVRNGHLTAKYGRVARCSRAGVSRPVQG